MKNKKGFTLIELLAVIVILAIIMVIAVPKILDVIESSRRNAAEVSIKLVKDAIKTQIASSEMMNNVFTKNGEGCYEFEFPEENENAEKLNVKNKENISGSIKYCSGRFEDDGLEYEGSVAVVCKRATSTTYGSLGTAGVLSTGDAFDCDVTGKGDFKRFYYVTSHGNNAVLIYNKNVENGVEGNAEELYHPSNNHYYGPVAAYVHLPSTTQWSNKKIISPGTRQITNEEGGTTATDGGGTHTIQPFTYTDKAARLLTYQEVVSACGAGSVFNNDYISSKCNFLLDNIGDGKSYWLETPDKDNNYVFVVCQYGSKLCHERPGWSYKSRIRPVIEVLKKYISY